MDAHSLVVGVGGRFIAWGRLLRTSGGGVWFGPELLHDGVWSVPPPRSVPAVGVDFEQAAHRRRRGGNEEGYAELIGTWQRDRVRIEQQSAVRTAREIRRPAIGPGSAAGEVDDLIADLLTTCRANESRWGLIGYNAGGTSPIVITLIRVTSEIADWVNAAPPGLVVLDPWLRPH